MEDAKAIVSLAKGRKRNDQLNILLSKKLGCSIHTAHRKLLAAEHMVNGTQPKNYGGSKIAVTEPLAQQEPPEPSDPIEIRRLKDRLSDASKALKSTELRLVKAEDVRGEIANLPPPKFSKIEPYVSAGKSGRRTVILHISDIQYGETIDIEALDGVNAYDTRIADARLARYFQKAHRFLTELWVGDPVDKIVVLLNGDMISGALHHELDRTDVLRPIPACQAVSIQLTNGLNLLRRIGAPIEIISTVGNHGRLTLKPESKGHVTHNYDDLVALMVEQHFAGDPLVVMKRSKSVDALFSVYGLPMLVTHGDRVGSRGGAGFMGATATILRGQQKVFTDYAIRGIHLYKIFTGHFHTPCETVYGYGNNCVAGVSEYARDGRMTPTPAAQGYLVVHEELGVIESRQIFVGIPEEGSSHSPVSKYRN